MITPERTALDLCKSSYDLATLPAFAVAFHLPSGERIGFCIEIGGAIWRVWKGSSTPFDWLEDAKCAPTAEGIHSGVFAVYSAALQSMITALGEFGSAPIRDTGHSLGGGLAELAWSCSPDAPGPITFAALRAFTTKRAESLPKDGIRFVNERDIVPHLPGRLGIWSYAHRSPAMRFDGRCMDLATAHSLDATYGPALDGRYGPLVGPMELE